MDTFDCTKCCYIYIHKNALITKLRKISSGTRKEAFSLTTHLISSYHPSNPHSNSPLLRCSRSKLEPFLPVLLKFSYQIAFLNFFLNLVKM